MSRAYFTFNTASLRIGILIAAMSLVGGQAFATPSFGFVSQTFRGRIAGNVGAHQWNPNPLFTLLIQSSGDQWGYDVVQGTTEFAAVDTMGRPSQSGWHDHPTALSIGLVVQGTVWSQDANDPSCLRPLPTGTVFFERAGSIHNNYNIDPRVPAVVRIIHFVDRSSAATRRDQPDPITGSTTTASPPPAPCATGAAGTHAGMMPPLPRGWTDAVNGLEPLNAARPAVLPNRRRDNLRKADTRKAD